MKPLTDISEAERLSIQEAVFADSDAALSDPTHPGWHFAPPAHFMLDVWGAIDWEGWHHIFYGVCRKTGAPAWDTVFGHARTRDFIHFEHLPFPICPAREELRMNDGSHPLTATSKAKKRHQFLKKFKKIFRAHSTHL